MLQRPSLAAPEVRDIAAEAGNEEEMTGLGCFRDLGMGFGCIEPHIL